MLAFDAATVDCARALRNVTRRIEANTAMMATTVSTSISVKPCSPPCRLTRTCQPPPTRTASGSSGVANARKGGDSDAAGGTGALPDQPEPHADRGAAQVGQRRHGGESGDLLPGGEPLQEQPKGQKPVRWDAHPAKPDEEGHLRPRERQPVEGHQSGDPPARPDHRHR